MIPASSVNSVLYGQRRPKKSGAGPGGASRGAGRTVGAIAEMSAASGASAANVERAAKVDRMADAISSKFPDVAGEEAPPSP